jgi:hypothetical protein
VSPIDEDPQSPGPSPQVLTFGEPQVGEILADRYRLEQHIGNDALGRQLWRGADVILQRPVTVVLRYPGGDSASEMLSAAVAASRIVHPHLVGVYDAIDEGERAYVVREWVEGTSLRDVVKDYGPLEADKTLAIGHAIAGAVAALHETGMVHGNVQPGTVLIGDDGRVVLADARADVSDTVEADIRALGAVLYCSLTGQWPAVEAGVCAEPDAARDQQGRVVPAHLVRDGVPTALDDVVTSLLDLDGELPSADILAAELARQDNAENHRSLFADEPLHLDAFHGAGPAGDTGPSKVGKKAALIVAALLVIAIVGVIAAANILGGGSPKNPTVATTGTAAPGKPPASGGTGGDVEIKVGPDQVRVVDADGDRDYQPDAKLTVDGNPGTGWKTNHYLGDPAFGKIKKGMGILLDLGKPTAVVRVSLLLGTPGPGCTVQLLGGDTDPAGGSGGDKQSDTALLGSFQPIGEPKADAQTNVVFGGDPDKKVRYVLVWFTKLPPDGNGFQVKLQEIQVFGQQ